MCGRYTLMVDAETLGTHFQLDATSLGHRPRYNIAPGQELPVITTSSGRWRISLMRWGLIPNWARDLAIGNKMINARAETIRQKPAFRDSFIHRRCLIPADGFYEWKRHDGNKVPMRINLPDNRVFAFAGIWDCWTPPEGTDVFSFSIITTAASEFMKDIHDRMPTILADDPEQERWLGDRANAFMDLLSPYRGQLVAYEVHTLVNSPRVDDPRCIEKKG